MLYNCVNRLHSTPYIRCTRDSRLWKNTRNINVNCVAPGFIETDMTKEISTGNEDFLASQIPLGRLGKPNEIADVVNFLASDQANYITGQTIHVNGGLYM